MAVGSDHSRKLNRLEKMLFTLLLCAHTSSAFCSKFLRMLIYAPACLGVLRGLG